MITFRTTVVQPLVMNQYAIWIPRNLKRDPLQKVWSSCNPFWGLTSDLNLLGYWCFQTWTITFKSQRTSAAACSLPRAMCPSKAMKPYTLYYPISEKATYFIFKQLQVTRNCGMILSAHPSRQSRWLDPTRDNWRCSCMKTSRTCTQICGSQIF